MSKAAEGNGTAAALACATRSRPDAARELQARSTSDRIPRPRRTAEQQAQVRARAAPAVEQAQARAARGGAVEQRRHEPAESAEPEVVALGARRGFEQRSTRRIVCRWPIRWPDRRRASNDPSRSPACRLVCFRRVVRHEPQPEGDTPMMRLSKALDSRHRARRGDAVGGVHQEGARGRAAAAAAARADHAAAAAPAAAASAAAAAAGAEAADRRRGVREEDAGGVERREAARGRLLRLRQGRPAARRPARHCRRTRSG